MSVARNVVFNPILAPGGGATEMAISVALGEKAKLLPGVAGAPYKAIADALEVIPRTLVQNCGGNAIRTLTELRVSGFFFLYFLFSLDMITDRAFRPSMRKGNISMVLMARLER